MNFTQITLILKTRKSNFIYCDRQLKNPVCSKLTTYQYQNTNEQIESKTNPSTEEINKQSIIDKYIKFEIDLILNTNKLGNIIF